LLDDVERIRVGSRLGLMGYGRESLAQAYYREALRCLEEGKRDRALLNVRMALNNFPRHLPALKLKERLLGERLWDDDGSRMHAFVWDLMQADRPEPTTPPAPYGRPTVDLDAVRPVDERALESAP
jgi:hypothetical protein